MSSQLYVSEISKFEWNFSQASVPSRHPEGSGRPGKLAVRNIVVGPDRPGEQGCQPSELADGQIFVFKSNSFPSS